jgi:hypothetical protein
MKALTPGHKYELENFEHSNQTQILQFIEKDAAMTTLNDGTTNEEILSMMVDRLRFLNEKLPSRETSIAITKIEEAQLWLLRRTADRRSREVEGTMKQ